MSSYVFRSARRLLLMGGKKSLLMSFLFIGLSGFNMEVILTEGEGPRIAFPASA